MSSINDTISIVTVNKDNYLEFSKLLEWRRTGIEKEDFKGYEGKEQADFFQEYNILNSKFFFIFAAKCDGKLVGYINAIMIPKPDPRLGVIYIDELWTAPAYRKRGIAEKLMKKAINLSKELNLWKVRLIVGQENSVARNFYKKMGFCESSKSLFCEMDVK